MRKPGALELTPRIIQDSIMLFRPQQAIREASGPLIHRRCRGVQHQAETGRWFLRPTTSLFRADPVEASLYRLEIGLIDREKWPNHDRDSSGGKSTVSGCADKQRLFFSSSGVP